MEANRHPMSRSVLPALRAFCHQLPRRAALPCLLLLAAGLRLWNLGAAGFGTEYYAAAVRSMLLDPHNLLYNAFDPAGLLSVDKPPLALWLQVLSARLLGYGPFALMLPQAIEGCLAVVLLWWLVRRDFGATAAVLAGLFLALTPVSVAVDRSNNTDSLLTLVLLLAACVLPRGGDKAAPWRLVLAMAFVGVGFNVKMLAAFGVLPGFVAAYALTARASWPRRIGHLAAAGAALAVVSAGWIGVVALTPPAERPYIDSSASNSILDLVVDHNAAQRFVPRAWRGAVTAGGEAMPGPAMGRRLALRTIPLGPARLADPALASQSIWLLPLALAGAVAMVASRRREAAALWIGWTAAYGLVFSFAGGLFSPYYLVMLGAPQAALAGVGVVALASWWQGTPWQRRGLPAVLVLGLAWQAHILHPATWDSARGALLIAALTGMLLALGVLLHPFRRERGGRPVAALAIGVAALLIAPAAWAVGTIACGSGRPLARLEPEPEYDRLGHAAAVQASELCALLPFLREHQAGARFLVATASARQAAPLIIATGAPVIAFGGFLGSMPVLDGAAIARLAESGALRFVVLGSGWPGRETDATRWVRAHGTRLDLATFAPALADARFDLYDLRQEQ
jgi:4-amino-4-deoxy-L-arabinose transferase-like glycosyltransferase